MIPVRGAFVDYTLSEQDAREINRRRNDARNNSTAGVALASQNLGSPIHVGNRAAPGDTFPMLIVRVQGDQPDSRVNGQVFLDGSDTLWVTSVTVGEGPNHFTWPQAQGVSGDKSRNSG